MTELRQLYFSYGKQTVLDGLTFDVRKGEVLCVVGPSGTGKSVTLKHLVRLLTPTSGRVLVDGTDVSACSDRELARIRSRIGYLFQGGALLAWMTVAENVALPLEGCTKLPDREIAVRVSTGGEMVTSDAHGVTVAVPPTVTVASADVTDVKICIRTSK